MDAVGKEGEEGERSRKRERKRELVGAVDDSGETQDRA